MATETKQTSKFAGKPQKEQYFLFDKTNYILMIAGIVLIFIGFMLMAGGKSANPHEFHYEEIYSFRRITLAPIVLLLGFVLEVYAIMKKPADTPEVQ
jgi:predicted tellurium resistance membrane protein TerC